MIFRHPELPYCREYHLPHEKTAAYANAAVMLDALFTCLDRVDEPHGLTFSIVDATPIGDEVSRVTTHDRRLLYSVDRVDLLNTKDGFEAVLDDLRRNVSQARWCKTLATFLDDVSSGFKSA